MAIGNDEWWLSQFGSTEELTGPVDYLSLDGKTAVEVKVGSHGIRGLHSAVLAMARYTAQNTGIERACLVLGRTRMSRQRMAEEWEATKSVLRPHIARRLAVIFVGNGDSWVSPDEPFLRQVAAHFESTWASPDHARSEQLPQPPGRKSYEVVKVLLNRWLLQQGPIAIGELADQVGCSYPTVRKALDETALQNHVTSMSNRSVELGSFPHDSWRELVTLLARLRNSFRFHDRTGEKPSPQDLLRRLERVAPSHVALGGVVAAKYWHSDFDLHGTPRIDLLYHVPNGRVDLDFVRKLDPALTESDDLSDSAVLVIHPLVRTTSLFAKRKGTSIPIADPVETALDLCDLSLTTQANRLLTHLRPEVRLA